MPDRIVNVGGSDGNMARLPGCIWPPVMVSYPEVAMKLASNMCPTIQNVINQSSVFVTR